MVKIGIPVRYEYSKDEGKPIICIYDSLRRVIQKAGAEIELIVPLRDIDYMKVEDIDSIIVSEEEKESFRNIIDSCDGLLLPGGGMFTSYDRFIYEYAVEKDIPTLGICLGMQMMVRRERTSK